MSDYNDLQDDEKELLSIVYSLLLRHKYNSTARLYKETMEKLEREGI